MVVSRRNERPEDARAFVHVDINHAGGNRGIRSQLAALACYIGVKREVRGGARRCYGANK